MVKRHIGAHALAERTAHKEIPRVDDERCESDLHTGSAAADEREEGVLARRGVAQKAGEQPLRYGESGIARGDAEGKRHGKIAETDGKAVAQAFKIDAAAAVGMRLLHSGFFLKVIGIQREFLPHLPRSGKDFSERSEENPFLLIRSGL